MSNKELFVKAHKMAKGIKKEYPEVNYMFQFSLCLSYLREEGGNGMVELKGTEKQVKWAEDIRKNYLESLNNIIEGVEKEDRNYVIPAINELEEEVKSRAESKSNTRDARKEALLAILAELKGNIENEETSKKFIEVYNSHRYFAPHEVSAIRVMKQFR